MKSVFPALPGLIVIILLNYSVQAQEDTTITSRDVTLDLLRAPVSPAANLLGISNSQIERPTDPAAFMTSLQTATSNFSGLPASYGVDLAPAWLFSADNIKFEDYLSPALRHTFRQSLVFSVATNTVSGTTDTMPDVTRFSAGLKFSLLRGRIGDETREQLSRSRNAMATLGTKYTEVFDSLKKSDERYLYLDSLLTAISNDPELSGEEKVHLFDSLGPVFDRKKDSMEVMIRKTAVKEFDDARKALEDVKIQRFGPKLDVAAAIAWDFPGMNFDQGQYSTFAVWASGGYEWAAGLSLLGLVRYLNFNGVPVAGDQQLILYKDSRALDAGLRLLYGKPYGRFSTSIEAIYRNMSGISEIESAWRFTVNAEYDVGKNKKLSLIFGRDFDGTYTGEGDLIVALNLLLGFGTGRKL